MENEAVSLHPVGQTAKLECPCHFCESARKAGMIWSQHHHQMEERASQQNAAANIPVIDRTQEGK